jgi:hypothetical protein
MNGEQATLKVFPVRQILLAGMAGGVAEIVWFMAIGLLLSLNVHDVAAGITSSISPGWGSSPYAAFTGILIHLFLSVLLAAAYIATLGRWSISRFGLSGQLLIGMSALALVWAINYLVILPVVNPSFIELSTYGLSLPSKVLFGISMALTFNYLVKGD